MTQRFVQPGDVLTLPAPSGGVVAGTAYKVGSGLFVIAKTTAAEGVLFDGIFKGVCSYNKSTSQAWAVGDKLYWDAGNNRLSTDSVDGMFVAIATAVALEAATTGEFVLCPGTEQGEGAQAHIPDFTFGVNIAAATANGALTDSSGTNPTEAQFNELAKEVGTKFNTLLAELRLAGILKTS